MFLTSYLEDYGWMFLKGVFYFLVIDIIFLRALPQIYYLWYYKSQGVPFLKPMWPLFGNYPRLIQLYKDKTKQEYFSMSYAIWESFGKNPPGILGAYYMN